MALLAFESSPSAPQSILELLSPAQRLKTAGEVNAAILESLSQGKDAKLVGLLKLLCWGETMLEEKAEFPKVRVRDAAIDALLTPAYCSLISERGCLRSYFHNFFFLSFKSFDYLPSCTTMDYCIWSPSGVCTLSTGCPMTRQWREQMKCDGR